MTTADLLDDGLAAFERREWDVAYAQLSAADRQTKLQLEDLERLALSAYMTGEEIACADAWTRAHQAWLAHGDPARATRCAFWQACGLLFKGDMAPAMGWIARGARVLEESEADCAERAWLLVLTNLPVMFQGDPATAYIGFAEAAEIAERFDDPDVTMFTRLGRGQALVMTGQTDKGLSLLDELMVAVTSGEVYPIAAGIAYCAVIDACQTLFDTRRAREWTAALTRWCDAQPGLVPFRGHCLIHRCQIMQLQGAWVDALETAKRACEWLSNWDSLGAALYQLGELHRLRGDFPEAEGAYRRASEVGREPEPGMALLRLAQGRVDVALAASRRVMDEAQDPMSRSKLLPSFIEIVLASGDLAAARAAADELTGIAAMLDAPYLHALAAHAMGSVLLAEGDTKAASMSLRRASAAWRELDAPHEDGRARVLIGVAFRQLGDDSSAAMELDAARLIFERLGARPDAERVNKLLGTPSRREIGGLTARELEVLRLVAGGMTNRAIATELVLSEKTVARHLSNIFTKLGLSSRSAATAYAYEHDLV